jgi:hypothetical protein
VWLTVPVSRVRVESSFEAQGLSPELRPDSGAAIMLNRQRTCLSSLKARKSSAARGQQVRADGFSREVGPPPSERKLPFLPKGRGRSSVNPAISCSKARGRRKSHHGAGTAHGRLARRRARPSPARGRPKLARLMARPCASCCNKAGRIRLMAHGEAAAFKGVGQFEGRRDGHSRLATGV